MLVMHLVILDWNPGVTADQVAAVDAALAALPDHVPQLISYSFGPNLRLRDSGGDYAICAVVDADNLGDYLDHPFHCEVRERVLAHLIAGRSAVQLAVEPLLAAALTEGRNQ